VSLNDRDALAVLHAAIDPADENGLIGRFYDRWFSFEASPRDLFPPDMAAQRVAFAQALSWVYGELVAQRAEEPVAFLAQLGRDHRKYGVLPGHYQTLGRALYTTLRDELADAWSDAVEAAAEQSLNLIVGVMSGAADAEHGPPWWDGTVAEQLRVSRDLAVVRVQLDHPMPYHPGQYVDVAVPQCPRRWRYLTPAIPPDDTGAVEFHVRAVSGGLVSSAIVNETRPGDRWRLSSPHGALQVDRDGGDVLMVAGSTGLAPLRSIVMDLTRWGDNPRVHLFFGGRYPC
jgi:hemoglobin-like flavoprotein